MVSIIIPVYQVKPYLRKCLHSVLDQSYHNLEIILVDDGSTDGSGEMCDAYASEDKRVRVIHQKNQGLSAARNAGIEIAKGAYLAFVDSDDWIDKDFIAILLDNCIRFQADISQCEYLRVEDELSAIENASNTCAVFTPREFSMAEFTTLSWRCNLAWNKLYRSSLFQTIRYPVGKIHEDEFTTYKLVWVAEAIVADSRRLYYYRQRQDSITGKSFSPKRLDAGEAYEEKIRFFETLGDMDLVWLNRDRYIWWLKDQLSRLRCLDGDVKQYIKTLELKLAENTQLQGTAECPVRRYGGNAFLFPFDRVPRGAKIILYGAGDVGTQYYHQIRALNYCSVVCWIDQNADRIKPTGYPVSTLENVDFDVLNFGRIVIALNGAGAAKKVIERLKRDYNIKQELLVYSISRV